MTEKIYPDSGVELKEFVAKNYDKIMNTMSFGLYRGFIKKAIKLMDIQPGNSILDFGCGTGRNASLMAKYIGETGHITGLDISELMQNQFLQKFKGQANIRFAKQRIDQLFDLNKQFDIVFISFVIHGFPHEIRSTVIQNALTHLKPGGIFYILDFAEFDMAKMPAFHRLIFKKIECKYAFDFIKRDWKAILKEAGFDNFNEHLYLKKYVRLLKAVKTKKINLLSDKKQMNMNNILKEQIENTIASVMHPAIDLSLITLGLVKDVKVTDEKAEVTFAFPFPNIPIGEQLINSVKLPVTNLGVAFDYQVVIMTEEEKQKFLQLEASAWKGM